MERSHISSLPQVSPATHVIGLCGVNDYIDEEGHHACDPSRDGWMLSDFYLLNHLFRDQGRTQAWYTCLDPTNLIDRYGEYAHGNSFCPRKIVLDQNQRPNPLTLQMQEPDNLLPSFLEYFATTCQVAKAANEPVLVCIFGHGDDLTYGVEIGGTTAEGLLLKIEDISNVLSTNEGIHISLLMKSCFSGGWAITPSWRNAEDVRMTTTMTAAGPDQPSEFRPLSESLGRACGSIYVSALIKALEDETGVAFDDGVTMTTKDFADAITTRLRDVLDPHFWHTHDTQFEIREDRWEDPYHQRTGIPAVKYRKQLDQLRTIPARSFQDITSDQSRTQAEVDKWNDEHPGAPHVVMAASNYGGSMFAVKRAIRKKAAQYMQSYPGRDSQATNITEHAAIRRCIFDPARLPESGWSMIWGILHYRMTSIWIAEIFLKRMRIKGPKASEWDFDAWQAKSVGAETIPRASRYYRMILDSNLLPRPYESGRPYGKPTWYLAVALVESGLPDEELKERLLLAKKGEF